MTKFTYVSSQKRDLCFMPGIWKFRISVNYDKSGWGILEFLSSITCLKLLRFVLRDSYNFVRCSSCNWTIKKNGAGLVLTVFLQHEKENCLFWFYFFAHSKSPGNSGHLVNDINPNYFSTLQRTYSYSTKILVKSLYRSAALVKSIEE